MAAYGAAVSLKNTIQHILQSSRISLVPPSPQILQPAYDAMYRLQKVLVKLESTGYTKIRMNVNDLDERIKDVVWEFEDLLESHVTHQILPQLERRSGGESQRDCLSFSVDLQSLQHITDRFVDKVMVMERAYDIELRYMPEEEGEPISSRIDYGGINSKMVGLSDEFERVRDYLIAEEDGLNWLSVIGMAGVGKTTLAKKVFDDPTIQRHFELRAWVKVGRKCESNETLQCILAQVDPNTPHQIFTKADDDDAKKLVGLLEERWKDKKCLIVLDDVWEWDKRVMDNLAKENVRVLLTSRLRFNDEFIFRSMLGIEKSPFQVVRLLDKEESKKLLGEKVFGEEGFPPHFEKLGKKIAKKCEGLPLMIVTVAELLSKEDMTPQYWTEVAKKQHNSIFNDAYNQISEVFLPSYDYLPLFLKMFFLYLGAFPPYRDIGSNIFYLMSAEGFLEPIGERTLEDFTEECLDVLATRYHLMLLEGHIGYMFLRKKLRVHSCLQHFCRKEASKIKFMHVLLSCDDVMTGQRRLATHCNTLFAFKEVYDSIKIDCASTIRSLLCLGPYHYYPLPIHAIDFKLLSVLDALKVRFYHVPLEIMKLVCLKYLALTCNNDIPVSISNLFRLQSLIIEQHVNIKWRGAHSYVPVEIWDMEELQHIQVRGRELPTPTSNATLDKLSELFGVSAKSCTREILKRVPNLKEIIILMELKPYDDDYDDFCNTLSGLGCISKELQNLERLSYVVTNPEMKYAFMVPLSMFPSSLKLLQLIGLGCPWKHINDICSLLPNLTHLELQHYAFRGPEWEIESGCFLKLETLVIEDTDLVRWRAQRGSLPRLDILSIRHCYKLQELDWARDPSTDRTPTIELVNCNPAVLDSVIQLSESLFKVSFVVSYLSEKSLNLVNRQMRQQKG